MIWTELITQRDYQCFAMKCIQTSLLAKMPRPSDISVTPTRYQSASMCIMSGRLILPHLGRQQLTVPDTDGDHGIKADNALVRRESGRHGPALQHSSLS